VLAQEAVDLTGADLEVHAVESLGTREVLDDVRDVQERRCGVCCDHGDTVWGHSDIRQSKVGQVGDSYVSVTCRSISGFLVAWSHFRQASRSEVTSDERPTPGRQARCSS